MLTWDGPSVASSGELDAKGSSLVLKEVEAELELPEGLLWVSSTAACLSGMEWGPLPWR